MGRTDGKVVVVTGAACGVGSVAIALLAKLGFQVIASTARHLDDADRHRVPARIDTRDALRPGRLACHRSEKVAGAKGIRHKHRDGAPAEKNNIGATGFGSDIRSSTRWNSTEQVPLLRRVQRAALSVMHPGRADVIGAGALVLDTIMQVGGFTELVASEHDILDGIAFSIVED